METETTNVIVHVVPDSKSELTPMEAAFGDHGVHMPSGSNTIGEQVIDAMADELDAEAEERGEFTKCVGEATYDPETGEAQEVTLLE